MGVFPPTLLLQLGKSLFISIGSLSKLLVATRATVSRSEKGICSIKGGEITKLKHQITNK